MTKHCSRRHNAHAQIQHKEAASALTDMEAAKCKEAERKKKPKHLNEALLEGGLSWHKPYVSNDSSFGPQQAIDSSQRLRIGKECTT